MWEEDINKLKISISLTQFDWQSTFWLNENSMNLKPDPMCLSDADTKKENTKTRLMERAKVKKDLKVKNWDCTENNTLTKSIYVVIQQIDFKSELKNQQRLCFGYNEFLT